MLPKTKITKNSPNLIISGSPWYLVSSLSFPKGRFYLLYLSSSADLRPKGKSDKSKPTGQISRKREKHFHATQRMNTVNFGDLMTFCPAPASGQNVQTPFSRFLRSSSMHQASRAAGTGVLIHQCCVKKLRNSFTRTTFSKHTCTRKLVLMSCPCTWFTLTCSYSALRNAIHSKALCSWMCRLICIKSCPQWAFTVTKKLASCWLERLIRGSINYVLMGIASPAVINNIIALLILFPSRSSTQQIEHCR